MRRWPLAKVPGPSLFTPEVNFNLSCVNRDLVEQKSTHGEYLTRLHCGILTMIVWSDQNRNVSPY